MKVKIIGAELKEGDYQGNKYSNVVLYYVSPVKKDSEIFGVCPQSVKIRSKWLKDHEIDVKKFNQRVVDIYFDRYQNVEEIKESAE